MSDNFMETLSAKSVEELKKERLELRKAQLLDSANEEISSKISSIEKILKEKTERILTLKKEINDAESLEDYDSAVKSCELMIIEDDSNKIKWERKLDSLKESKAKYEEKKSILEECRKKVTDAAFNDDWDEVQVYSKRALEYCPTDEFYNKYLQKAVKELAKNAAGSRPIVKESGKNVVNKTAKKEKKDDFFDTPIMKKTLPKKNPKDDFDF